MDIVGLLKKIRVVVSENVSSRELRDLLFDNKNLTRNQPVNSEFIMLVVKYVALSNNEEMVKVFLEFLEPEAEDDLEKQLIIATLEGNLKKAEFLLKSGAKVKFENEDLKRFPAIYSCVLYSQTKTRREMLRLLINHGLDIHIKSDDLYNLYHVLAESESDTAVDLAQILFDTGLTAIDQVSFYESSPLLYIIKYGQNFKLAEFLIDKGADFKSTRNHAFEFPLFYAFIYGKEELIDLLLSRGADINARDQHHGDTILHHACMGHDLKMIRLLLKRGASLNVVDKSRKTPILLLEDDEVNYKECLIAMIKEISKSGTSCISEINMNFIRSYSEAQELLNKCLNELSQMKSLIFYAPYSYYSVLEMSKNLKKLSNLTKNEEFVAAFNNNLTLVDLYSVDLNEIFEDAVRHREDSLKIKTHLKSIFKDIFPELVMDKVTKNLRVTDIKME